jgi:hypothetical protein
MFLKNKYNKWYFSIIETAKKRELGNIKEIHHIIPKSLGGNNDSYNLVDLTPREHYICHWLLTKMTEGKYRMKMTFALHTFFHFNKNRKLNFRSRQYEYHKKLFIEACVQRIPHTKKDLFIFKHQKTCEEFKGTISDFKKHSGLSGQDINWLVQSCNNPDDSKKKIKQWGIWIDSLNIFSYDKPRPDCTLKGLVAVTCEYCKKTMSNGNYYRWHGRRCKTIDTKGHYERTRQIARLNRN